MTTLVISEAEISALHVAHARYVTMLSAFNRLRCCRESRARADYENRLVEARRHAKEAYTEWVMLAQLHPDSRVALS